jgi:hypothetical protein
MTLVGKIFTVLIFIMSLVFMSFAVMVFATHKNWKEAALSKEPSKATGQIGLKPRLDEAYAAKRGLELELESLKTQLAEHQAARRMALAVLQSKVEQTSADLVAMQSSLDKLQTAHTTAVAELGVANATLAKVTTDNGQLRTDIVTIQQDRDEKLARVVALADTANQAQTKLTQLEERKQQLIEQVAYQKLALETNGINPDVVPVSLEKPVDGVVTAVSKKNLIEISIGMDDGIREGVALEAYRGNKYLGKVIVRKVTANRSVAEIDPNFLQAPIREGDRVASKL